MKSERDWEKYEREYEGRRVESEAKARRRRLEEASSLGRSSSGLGVWLVGGSIVTVGLIALYAMSGSDEPAKPSPPSPSPTPTPPPGQVQAGAHVQARDPKIGGWYGATVVTVSPLQVRWDAGTPGAARNPRSGTSPASAARPG